MKYNAIKKELEANLLTEHVKEREGKGGKMLKYIESWHCIDELNRIFGYDGWEASTEFFQTGSEVKKGKFGEYENNFTNAKVTLRVRFEDQWITRQGTGYGEGLREFYMQSAESDALKRAARTLGNPFGNPLYNEGDERVTIVKTLPKREGNAVYKTIIEAMRMAKNLDELQEFWKDNAAAFKSLPPDWKPHVIEEKDRLKEELSK